MILKIMTRRAGYNFGSSLQAYAIHKGLEKIGFPNEVIDYDEYNHFILWQIKPFLNDLFFFLLSLNLRVSRKLFSKTYDTLLKRDLQKKAFMLFEDNNIKTTPKKYKTSKQLQSLSESCNAIICGSDQIWSPLLFDPNFFLCFCNPKKTKLIAYAPSFGVSEIKHYSAEIKNYLSRFHAISVREKIGADVIKKILNKNVPILIDPTLLLTTKDWDKLTTSQNINRPYILCYFLGNKLIPFDFINDMQKKLNLQIVNLTTFRTRNQIQGIQKDIQGPSDFISLIKNAQYICTDSFHATVFSILYQKKFFVFDKFLKTDAINQNSRIETLLSLLHLESCMQDNTTKVYRDIQPNFSETNAIIEIEQKKTLIFLKEALNNRIEVS